MRGAIFLCLLAVSVSDAASCAKHRSCKMDEFCAGGAGCLPCKQCGESGDSYNGKCPCGPGKKKGKAQPKKKQPAAPADDVDPVLDEAPAKGACSKHKDCTMKEFCAGGAGCLPCKQCGEPGDSYNGKCPCGPGKKKKKAPKKESRPPAPQKAKNIFAMMDKNQDGVITYDDEFVPWMKNEQDYTDMKEIKSFFADEDEDKVGRIGWDEFTGPKGKTAP